MNELEKPIRLPLKSENRTPWLDSRTIRRGTENRCPLFDGDRFGEIARLIDVAAAAHGDVVREQLQRNDFENRRDQIRARWEFRSRDRRFRARAGRPR